MDNNLMIIFSGVVALATVVYAILTWRLVAETKRLREAQTEPEISVIHQPNETFIGQEDMVIQNIGLGPAYEIRFGINPDFECRQGIFISKFNLIQNGLPYLAPNQKRQLLLGDAMRHRGKAFKVKVRFKNAVGKSYEREYEVNFDVYEGAFLQETSMNKLVPMQLLFANNIWYGGFLQEKPPCLENPASACEN